MAADSKANLPVGPWGRVSHRFVASTTSQALAVRFSQRGGPDGYSGGTGGTMRVSIREDAGGVPSDDALAELFFEPDNPDGDWTRFDRLDFPAAATLTEGDVYHVVYENVDPAPLENFISVNDLFVYEAAELSRPPGLGPEFVTLDEEEGAWDEQSQYTPVVDVVYADGTHDGQAYIEALVEEAAFMVGDLVARQWFIVSGPDRVVRSVSVRARRTFGDGPLRVRLETADGTDLASVDVPAEQIRIGVPEDFGEDVSEVWVTAAFPEPLTLTSGLGYNLVLSTDAETEYSSIPLREGTVEGLESYRFLDGGAQQTFDGGTVWIDVFDLAPADLQFFFQ
jgi:hypothetical protein